MNIAFDAKRAYGNRTGLGNYSRGLIAALAEYYPEHAYYLMTPRVTGLFKPSGDARIIPVEPKKFPSTWFRSLWRSHWVKSDLARLNIGLYHGLSHEIPLGISKTSVKSVVTIHDLIFERFPGLYSSVDVRVYRSKFRYACENADRIIAISEQTRRDIVEFYQIAEDKIRVCYQSCDAAFGVRLSDDQLLAIRKKYQLPERFFLSVGALSERKNVLNTLKALRIARLSGLEVPLVIVGRGHEYKKLYQYAADHDLSRLTRFLSYEPGASRELNNSTDDLVALYQLSSGLIYTSIFEGFGIPILEAFNCHTPVIASNVSCMPETGADAALYVDPGSPEELAEAMRLLLTDENKVADCIEKGIRQARKFTPSRSARSVMEVYRELAPEINC